MVSYWTIGPPLLCRGSIGLTFISPLEERVLAGEDASKIVQDWVSYYDSNNTEGMVALVNFILRVCQESALSLSLENLGLIQFSRAVAAPPQSAVMMSRMPIPRPANWKISKKSSRRCDGDVFFPGLVDMAAKRRVLGIFGRVPDSIEGSEVSPLQNLPNELLFRTHQTHFHIWCSHIRSRSHRKHAGLGHNYVQFTASPVPTYQHGYQSCGYDGALWNHDGY